MQRPCDDARFQDSRFRHYQSVYGSYRCLASHARIIKSVLKASIDQYSIAARVHGERDMAWRTFISQLPLVQRKFYMQSRPGRRIGWDDWLFKCFGPAWRDTVIVGLSSKHGARALLAEACDYFGLPIVRPVILNTHIAPTSHSTIAFSRDSDIRSLPLPEMHHQDGRILPGMRQLEFVVDNDNLAKVLNGEATTKDLSTFTVLFDIIDDFMKSGWQPRMHTLPLVTWRRRTWNTLADALANLAMNDSRDVMFTVSDVDYLIVANGELLQCHSDGGVRSDTCAAIGFTVTHVVPSSDRSKPARRLIVAGAHFISTKAMAAAAEASALIAVMRVVRHHSLA